MTHLHNTPCPSCGFIKPTLKPGITDQENAEYAALTAELATLDRRELFDGILEGEIVRRDAIYARMDELEAP